VIKPLKTCFVNSFKFAEFNGVTKESRKLSEDCSGSTRIARQLKTEEINPSLCKLDDKMFPASVEINKVFKGQIFFNRKSGEPIDAADRLTWHEVDPSLTWTQRK